MKRSKLLIPTLSTLAVTPAMALTACNQTNIEDQILDCIFKPIDLEPTVKADFVSAYKNEMSTDEKKSELLYDAFGVFNQTTIDNGTESIRNLWKVKNEGAFKVNIADVDVYLKDGEYYATLRGYIAYVFAKEHSTSLQSSKKITLKANDFIMITYQFKNVRVVTNDYAFTFDTGIAETIMGIIQYKYDGGKEEIIEPISKIDTSSWQVKNSKRWVQTL